MNVFIFTALMAILIILIFLILHVVSKAIYGRVKVYFNKKVDPKHILPEEEIKNQKQLFYLALIILCGLNLLYTLECHGFLSLFSGMLGTDINLSGILYGKDINFIFFEAMDIVLSLFLSLKLDLKSRKKDRIIFLLLVPFGSMETFIFLLTHLTEYSGIILLDILHMIGMIYFIRFSYKKFINYSRNNALGRTILLFSVLMILTVIAIIITENVNILDSLNMFTNAFASNGYDILGTTVLGKLNEMLIVWGGYILSGVGTATLTAAIIVRHFNYKFKEYDDINRRFDELEEIIKNKKNNKKE